MTAINTTESGRSVLVIRDEEGGLVDILDIEDEESTVNSFRNFLKEKLLGNYGARIFMNTEYDYTVGLSGESLLAEYEKLSAMDYQEADWSFATREMVVNALLFALEGRTDLWKTICFRNFSLPESDASWAESSAALVRASKVEAKVVGDRVMVRRSFEEIFENILNRLDYFSER